MRKQKIKLPIKLIIVTLILFALLLYIGSAIANFLKVSDYFKIKEVMALNGNVSSGLIREFKGVNIFTVGLRKISLDIQRMYPENKLIRVSRSMPDQLVIEFRKRIPVATVKLNKYFFTDCQGVLFATPLDQTKIYIPVIEGLGNKIVDARIGARYQIPELKSAINLIVAAHALGITKKYPIKNIVVSNPDFIEFTLTNGLKVKITEVKLIDRLGILFSLISKTNLDLNKVEYIDLRFNDPTIKLKDVIEK